MDTGNIVRRLAALELMAEVPRADLEWMAALGRIDTYEAGSEVRGADALIEEMDILLEGRVGMYMEKGGARRKATEATGGQVLGVIPYSRFKRAPGLLIVEEPTTVFALHQRHFPEMIREHMDLTAALVHHMLDRARDYRTVQLQDERLQSLGRLASGLAHELNNPASAAARNAQSLSALLEEAERAGRSLAAANLSSDQLSAIDAVRAACIGPARSRTAIEAADREDDIADWLDDHGIDAGAAGSLASTEIDMAALDRLAEALPADTLRAAIRWVASGNAARESAKQIENATGRIHDVVSAIRGFTFMDREGVPEQVDVARGLADTIAVLENKVRAKSVAIQIETAPDLPRIQGIGSQINQILEKVIDNAIDAVGRDGRITITATSRNESVLVRVMDDGAGIPEEIRARVFDPFFTTKPVGKGTGLGLDMARRLVHLHGGDIDFTTQPGRTVFRVRLPIHGARVN